MDGHGGWGGRGSGDAVRRGGVGRSEEAVKSKAYKDARYELIVGDATRQMGMVDGEARKGGKRHGSGVGYLRVSTLVPPPTVGGVQRFKTGYLN